MKANKPERSYMDSVHRDGTVWNLIVMFILIAFPIVVGLIFQAVPDWRGVGLGLLATAASAAAYGGEIDRHLFIAS